jgi:aspartate/methionine/tyrosine aminotransferase
MFSHRTDWELAPNALSEAVAARRRDGSSVIDWTLSNPTAVGLPYPEAELLRALGHPGALRYDPDPRGLPLAREALARRLARMGGEISPESLVLTSSSSEAYGHLFRLLADPGGEILIPKPGYPLFDDLARLSDVRAVPYRLEYDGSWHLDQESVLRGLTERTRAIVVIHPGNPTGSYFAAGEQEFLAELLSARGLPLISDEVFWPFHFSPTPPSPTFLSLPAPLLFVIGGLSKLAGLPQMKLGWVALAGEKGRRAEAIARLEMIGDTYLSVNTPVQRALGEILELTSPVTEALRTRAAANHRILRRGCEGSPASCLSAQGGWNAILRIPGSRSDEEWALDLLARDGLLTFPGHYFDLQGGTYLVVSLIVPEQETRRNLGLLLGRLSRG